MVKSTVTILTRNPPATYQSSYQLGVDSVARHLAVGGAHLALSLASVCETRHKVHQENNKTLMPFFSLCHFSLLSSFHSSERIEVQKVL
jgi:hypothetical protein